RLPVPTTTLFPYTTLFRSRRSPRAAPEAVEMIAVALYFRGSCGVRRIFDVMLRHLKKPVLTVLSWQLAATAVLLLIAALAAGGHGSASSLGGGVDSLKTGTVD